MFVKSKNGLKVPRHDNSTRYIGDEVVEIPDDDPGRHYYLRRLADGEIMIVEPAAKNEAAKK